MNTIARKGEELLTEVIHSRLHGVNFCYNPLHGAPFAVRKFASGSVQESFFAISSNLPDSKMTCDSV